MTIKITQEYLEKIRKESLKTNLLVDSILNKALESAKRGDWASTYYLHESEFTYDIMLSTYDILLEREFKVKLDTYKPVTVEGYIGDIQIYLDEGTLAPIKGGKLATLHKGDLLLPPKDIEKLLGTSKVLENIMKQITPTISKLNKTHETDSVNDNKEVSDALDKAVDVFNIVFNISEETKKSAQDLVKDMANELKKRGLR